MKPSPSQATIDGVAVASARRPPRVVLDLEKLRHIHCGLGQFSLHFAREMLRTPDRRFEPVLLLPRGAERHFPGVDVETIRVAPWRKEVVLRMARGVVQPLLPTSSIALWHVTNQMSRYLPLDGRVPVVLTIHDLNFLHVAPHDEHLRSIGRKMADMQRRVNRAAAIVTDSAFVASDVAEHFDLGGRPVHVVPLGMTAPVPASAERPPFAPREPFLLTVGNALAHKNFHVLFDLLPRLPGLKLVVAGKMATPYGEFLQREIARRRLGERVVLPGVVSDGDRQWLYEQCEAFLFPSLTEGFGFPVLEAMQCGKPVFMSRKTSLPEVAGDHGFYFDSYDAEAMAEVFRDGMKRFLADPGFGQRARTHAASFSWAETARGYARVYRGILGDG
ncbi:MAG: glycosyltransferase family 1 protein [Planctomycetia bacterium]|nr:glycosyltransferase family 1 protein [Planctomycetia bacterium]